MGFMKRLSNLFWGEPHLLVGGRKRRLPPSSSGGYVPPSSSALPVYDPLNSMFFRPMVFTPEIEHRYVPEHHPPTHQYHPPTSTSDDSHRHHDHSTFDPSPVFDSYDGGSFDSGSDCGGGFD